MRLQKTYRYTAFSLFALFVFLLASRYVSATIYNPGETLNPDCIMGSSNCGVDLFSSFIPYTGATTTIDLNSQLLTNVSALNVTSTTTIGQSVLITSGNPDGIGTSSQDTGSNLLAEGSIYDFHIYSYRMVNGVQVFSQNYTDIPFTDDNLGGTYSIGLTWDTVPGVSGYRVVIVRDDEDAYYSDHSIDTTNDTIEYDGLTDVNPTSNVSPSSYVYSSGGFLQVDGSGSIAGNVTINNDLTSATTKPATALTVSGTIFNDIGNSSQISQIATTSVGNDPQGIAISGKYLYVTNQNDNTLSVVNISDPHHPIQIATTSVPNGPNHIVVSGNYLYIGLDGGSGHIPTCTSGEDCVAIIDVSNHFYPIITAIVNVGEGPYDIAISGKYLYAVNNVGHAISITDISNPYNPFNIASLSVGNTPNGIVISSHYAYITDTNNNDIYTVDISNPYHPVQIATTSVGNNPLGVAISAPYLYVVNESDNDISIVDISNPYHPVQIATTSTLFGTSIGGDPENIVVSGRYAYVTNPIGNTFSVIDVSNPYYPIPIADTIVGNSPNNLAVSGKYGYTVNTNDGTISVIDLGGIDTGNLSAGALEAGNINVDNNIDVAGSVNIGTALSVGAGGILSNGDLSVNGTTTTSGLKISNLSNTFLAVDADGNVIAASSSFSRVFIYASSLPGIHDNSNLTTGGGTDDTAVLQSAINNISSYGGGTLVIDGVFLVSGLVVPSNITIEGLGWNTGFYRSNYADVPIIRNADPSTTTVMDKNIQMINFAVNANGGNQNGCPLLTEGDYFVQGIAMYGVDNVTLDNLHFINTNEVVSNFTGAIAGCSADNDSNYNYAFFFSNWSNITVENSYIEQGMLSGNDGIHFIGSGNNAIIKNVRGYSGDDFIAFNSSDYHDYSSPNSPSWVIEDGPQSNILVDGVNLQNSTEGISFLSGYDISNVRVENITGTTTAETIHFWNWYGGSGSVKDIIFDNVNAVSTGDYVFKMEVGSRIDNMQISNSRWENQIANGPSWIGVDGTVINDLQINNMIVDEPTTGTDAESLIGLVGSSASIGSLAINGLDWERPSGSNPAGYYILSGNGAINSTSIADINIPLLSGIAESTLTISTNQTTMGGSLVVPGSVSIGNNALFLQAGSIMSTGTMAIDATNIGINTANPANTLDVNGTFDVSIPLVTETGAMVSTNGTDTVLTYNGSGTFDPGAYVSEVQVLVVGGGGGGGAKRAGGGGGGGVIYDATHSVTNNIYTITVGAGGARDTTENGGSNGSNSIFDNLTAIGGGGGGGDNSNDGHNGGSGGGGGADNGIGTGGSGTIGQGNNGGSGNTAGEGGGGGGGAGGVGVASTTYGMGGNGGNGILNSITGTSTYYGGGGGGGGFSSGYAGGIGGEGGGGAGSESSGVSGLNGTDGLGGGGGGGNDSADGGTGGRGVVIISYPTNDTAIKALTIMNSGNIGIGTTTPSATLTIVGNPASTTLRLANFGAGTLMTDSLGNVYDNSDERLKNIIGTSTIGLNELEGLTPINYYWNATSGLDMTDENTGFSAQNVEQYIPNAVATDTRGYLTLQDRPIIAALVNAVKEIGSFISTIGNGLAHLTGIAIGTSDKPEGITMYDESTGQPYCVVINNGILVNNPGECTTKNSSVGTSVSTTESITTTSTDEIPVENSSSSSTPATNTPDIASSTESASSTQSITGTDASTTPQVSTSTSALATTTLEDIIATTTENTASSSDETDATNTATSTGS